MTGKELRDGLLLTAMCSVTKILSNIALEQVMQLAIIGAPRLPCQSNPLDFR